jgi:glucuronate isomerase
MNGFMSPDFLLKTDTARELYHTYAEGLPIYDFHCHLSPRDIAEDKKWADITELWLGGDHYKWRALRSQGVDEHFITGTASPYEKFEQWARLMPRLIGNPLYHWTHLELQRYFDINEPLSPETCTEIYERCNERLKTLSAKGILRDRRVKLVCTADDPCDDLMYHERLKGFETAVLPSFRPDKALNIDKNGFLDYLDRLEKNISDFDSLKAALVKRLDYFHLRGCRSSDHGLDYVPSRFEGSPNAVLKKALSGKIVTKAEAETYKTALLTFLAGEYTKRGWVMQLHFGAVRNLNPVMYRRFGADTGFDAIGGPAGSGEALGTLLGCMEANYSLPKTVLYSLNPTDNAQVGTVLGCFQSAGIKGKIQQGSAWWFNDTKQGMEEQLSSLASLSVLPNFIGMVTDSRSFLSYARHEYFRRILCNLLGRWVEDGDYPNDLETLGKIVTDISCNNAREYFNL